MISGHQSFFRKAPSQRARRFRGLEFARYAPLLLVSIVSSGCGDAGGRVDVQGKLTAKGLPVDHATVVFTPVADKIEGSMGRVEADGTFRLFGPRSLKRGVIPGDYTVLVSRPILPDGRPRNAAAGSGELPPAAYESIPANYSGTGSKGVAVTVPPKGGPITIDLPEGLVEKPQR
jgi:hypothetical protein